MMLRSPLLGALWLCLCSISCEGRLTEDSPEHVVREFITRMQGVHGEPAPARAAFELLWAPAQRNLTERAARASALAGRKVAPEEMIAPTHFSLRFQPQRYSVTEQGDRATVRVFSDTATSESRDILCVREERGWRVALELPQLAPIQKRRELVHEE